MLLLLASIFVARIYKTSRQEIKAFINIFGVN